MYPLHTCICLDKGPRLYNNGQWYDNMGFRTCETFRGDYTHSSEFISRDIKYFSLRKITRNSWLSERSAYTTKPMASNTIYKDLCHTENLNFKHKYRVGLNSPCRKTTWSVSIVRRALQSIKYQLDSDLCIRKINETYKIQFCIWHCSINNLISSYLIGSCRKAFEWPLMILLLIYLQCWYILRSSVTDKRFISSFKLVYAQHKPR